MLWFLVHKQWGRISCVSSIPYSKSQFLVGPLRYQAKEEQLPWRIQPSFCNDFNQFASLQCWYVRLQFLSSIGNKIEANRIEATNSCDSLFPCFCSFVTSLNTTLHLIFELIPVVRPMSHWPLSLCPPRGGLPSSQGCQASSLALHSTGRVWPKQHGLAIPSDMQSWPLKPPSIGSCRSARCWPGRFSWDPTLSTTRGNHWQPHQQKKHIAW